jgi:thiol-disulfide isomerase/thioredoxin
MRKVFYSACLCLLAITCKQSANQLVLTGTDISVTDDIYVYDVAESMFVDTIKVTGGNFIYTRKIADEPKLLLITDNTTMMHYLIAEKGNLTLAGDTGFIKGSPLNDRMADLFGIYNDVGKELEDKKIDIVETSEKAGVDLTEEQILELQNLERKQSAIIGDVVKKFYEQDKNTVLGIIELSLLQGAMSEEEFISLYEQGGDIVKNFPPFIKILEAKANTKNLTVGAKYVDLCGINPNDTSRTIRLSDFVDKDKYILLDFWASWCGPCRKAMPDIKLLNDKYSNKGLEVIGIVVNDNIEDHLEAAKDLKVTWTQIFDDKKEFVPIYGVNGIPTLILLDKDGTILVRTHNKNEITEKIQSLLGK